MSIQAINLVRSRHWPSAGHKFVAYILADYADSELSTFVSQARIALDTQMGERSVRRYLADLQEHGLIQRDARYQARGRQSDRTRLMVDAIQRLPATVAARRSDLPANGADLPAKYDRSTGQALAGVTVGNDQKNGYLATVAGNGIWAGRGTHDGRHGKTCRVCYPEPAA